MFQSALLFVFPAAMAFAGAMDLLTMTIPNRISIFLVAAFAVMAPLAGLPLDAILSHVGAGLLVLAICIGLFALRTLGGGDAKLLAAASLWIGFDHLLVFVTQVAIFGGVLALLILAYRRMPVLAGTVPGWAERLHRQGTGIPYGLAIAAGALAVFPQTAWFTLLAPTPF